MSEATTSSQARASGQRVAVFGGSFDPPHLAHGMAARLVLQTHPVDRVLLIPTYRHPFAKALAPYRHRARMCELAVTDLERVEVSRIEQELGGESLTVRTLEELQRRMPQAALRLVIGSDLLAETARWHSYERIAELAPPIVLARGGYPLPGWKGPELPELSSSEARRRIALALDTSECLATPVAEYIALHGLYR